MATKDNLKAAFAGESQANRKYLAFSEKAKNEGYEKLSRMFRAIAEAETIHALKHLQVMQGIGTTADNLKQAVEGETYEFTEMYPGFIKEAEEEGNQQARMAFHFANEAEKAHGGLFKKALEYVEQGKDIEADSFYLCPVCGYVAENEAPEKCPICGTPGSKFQKF